MAMEALLPVHDISTFCLDILIEVFGHRHFSITYSYTSVFGGISIIIADMFKTFRI